MVSRQLPGCCRWNSHIHHPGPHRPMKRRLEVMPKMSGVSCKEALGCQASGVHMAPCSAMEEPASDPTLSLCGFRMH